MTAPGRRLLATALSLVAILPLAGCTNPLSDSKDDNVQTVAEADTKKTITEYAEQIAQVAGKELKNIGLNSAPCTGRLGEDSKDVYTTQGSYQIFVPQTRHAAILAELHQQWQARGFTIRTYRQATEKLKDKLEVVTPDSFVIELISTEPPTALAVLINGPCRRSPTPLF